MPNQVSLISAAFTFTGIVLLATVPPSIVLGIIVWLLLAVGYAWDSADGQVARLRGGGSLAGEWLDHVLDSTKLVALPLAVAIGWYRFFPLPSDLWLLVPLGFAVISTVTFFGMILNDLLRGKKGVAQAAQAVKHVAIREHDLQRGRPAIERHDQFLAHPNHASSATHVNARPPDRRRGGG